MGKLEGKKILLTGASAGIGVSIAERCAAEGAMVFLTARRKDRLEQLAARINQSGGTAAYYQADLAQPANVDALFAVAHETLGAIDVLINNAGFGRYQPFLEMDFTIAREMFEVNFFAAAYLTQKVLRLMLDRQGGDIVNIVSLAGKNPVPNLAMYAATKYAMRGFFESLYREVRQHNIRILNLYPGTVATEFFQRSGYPEPDQKRVLQPADIAEAVVCSLHLPRTATVSDIDLRPTNP